MAGWNKGDEGKRRNNIEDREQEQIEGSHHYSHQGSDTTHCDIVI